MMSEINESQYTVRSSGLYLGEKRISDPIKVTALSRTVANDGWKKTICFLNMDGEKCTCHLSQKTLLDKTETLKILGDLGFNLNCDPRNLVAYLLQAKPLKRLREVLKIGWIDQDTFICPSFSICKKENEELFLSSDESHGFEKKDSLEEWQEQICALCEGNSILTLALCVGLSGVLLNPLNIEPVMVNLVGRSSIGKTTALYVAASLWGNPKRFIQQWRTTSNALEALAEYHNDCLLILDELGQIQASEIGNTVYMLGNAKGKKRLNKDSELKPSKEWNLAVLSSGEIGIADKIAESGKKAKAGQMVRCIDIESLRSNELGIFDTLHADIENGAKFSNLLKQASLKYHGAASEKFITSLMHADINIRDLYEQQKRKLTEPLGEADGEVIRVAETFALFILSGVLACRFKVFTHKEDELVEMISEVFRRWLKERGGKRSIEESQILERLHGALEINKGYFDQVNNGVVTETRSNIWWGIHEIGHDFEKYYINTSVFKNELFKGFNQKSVRKILLDKNILLLDHDGRNPKCSYTSPKYKRMITLIL
jgi:putative DNA primase/helicase